jgi:choline dehydrogenase
MDDIFYSHHHSSFVKSRFWDGDTQIIPEFDFIVVGGGPSGCAVASRLAEGGKFTVLLIEQGTTFVVSYH